MKRLFSYTFSILIKQMQKIFPICRKRRSFFRKTQKTFEMLHIIRIRRQFITVKRRNFIFQKMSLKDVDRAFKTSSNLCVITCFHEKIDHYFIVPKQKTVKISAVLPIQNRFQKRNVFLMIKKLFFGAHFFTKKLYHFIM